MNTRGLKFLLMILSALCCHAATPQVYEQKIQLLNDDGGPLVGVQIHVSSVVGWIPGRDFGKDIEEKITVVTDNGGWATVRIRSGNGLISFSIEQSPVVYGQRWQRKASEQSPTTMLIYAKARVNPVPMFVRQIGPGYPFWERDLPTREFPCSFDLLKGDWLPPHGKGETADLIIQWVQRGGFCNLSEPFDASLNISFGGKWDGIVAATSKEPGPTSMPLPRYAPVDGYANLIELRIWRESGGPLQTTIPDVTARNLGYFFRIRTVVDEAGNLIAARYGKLVGAISFRPLEDGRTPLSFWYFINGADNDRNMEHRMDTNLFGDADPAGRQRR